VWAALPPQNPKQKKFPKTATLFPRKAKGFASESKTKEIPQEGFAFDKKTNQPMLLL